MKKSLFVFCPILFTGMVMMFVKDDVETFDDKQRGRPAVSDIISCAPGIDEELYAGKDGKFISILPGWGDHAYPISTQSDSAQIYFNQGLSMYYSYHGREAVASFKEAAKFDSSCAMAYWGQALALGPSYNFGYSYKMNKNVPAVITAMNRYTALASPKEIDLINAMNMRYDLIDTSDKQRKELNVYYATALKPLVARYPDDLDIKALYTDAVMLLHSWDFWKNDGTPKAWTPELVQYCEDILKQDPHHPAALHYYIHVTEASRNPEVALASADSLIKLFPGVAHMVHMSSHEYERIGYYAKGVDANEKADRDLVLYDQLTPGLYPVVHATHYFAVDAYCALSGAMYKKALTKTMACRNSVKPTHAEPYGQYMYMYPSLAMVRMGKWQEILRDTTSIDPQWSFAGLLNDFAKGMAYARTGSFPQAVKRLEQLRENQKDSILKIGFSPFKDSPYDCSVVAENILAATIYFEQKKYGPAMTAIKNAILAEDKLLYAEPKIWMLPARQYLGAFLLKLKKPGEAERVYREDLVWNPSNGWSLLGLYQSLKVQQKSRELKKIKALYTISFSHADAMPPGSAY
jgi:tetratricopeptide (TPR) repeat protein